MGSEDVEAAGVAVATPPVESAAWVTKIVLSGAVVVRMLVTSPSCTTVVEIGRVTVVCWPLMLTTTMIWLICTAVCVVAVPEIVVVMGTVVVSVEVMVLSPGATAPLPPPTASELLDVVLLLLLVVTTSLEEEEEVVGTTTVNDALLDSEKEDLLMLDPFSDPLNEDDADGLGEALSWACAPVASRVVSRDLISMAID